MDLAEDDIREAFDAIINGHLVKRDRHSLVWEDADFTPLFVERLRVAGFLAKTVVQSAINPGHRSPAFQVKNQMAHFGWVKWTKFDEGVYLKYFASEHRKRSGTPEIIISSNEPWLVFVNDHLAEPHDPDQPPLYA